MRRSRHRTPTGRACCSSASRRPKTVKNRVHLDVRVGKEGREAEVTRLLGLGATELLRGAQGPFEWATLADPEGNEFCVT